MAPSSLVAVEARMSRVALLSSEPLRPHMAGIGIRYLELARRLPAAGFSVVLVTPGAVADVPELPSEVEVRTFERGGLAALLADCDAAVAQGQLANDLVLEVPDLPTVIDLYDPWLVENLHYVDSLGLDPYRNDHATWVLQLSRGDFFLCSCEEQRQFYLGLLTALGRVHPYNVREDPDLQSLVATVPFGVPETLPAHRPWLPSPPPSTRRLLFGGLYDWYDPWPVLHALERVDRPAWQLLLIRNPNAEGTPQRRLAEVEAWCRARGWWEDRVLALDWVPAERRFDLLRDVDLMVATHHPSLETRLSMRTRFLEALVAGCPVIATSGGAISRLLEVHGAGWVVPPDEPDAVARALEEALDAPAALAGRRDGAKSLLEAFSWDRSLAPLVQFLQAPRLDASKDHFAHRPTTVTPSDPPTFRARRAVRRWASRFGRSGGRV